MLNKLVSNILSLFLFFFIVSSAWGCDGDGNCARTTIKNSGKTSLIVMYHRISCMASGFSNFLLLPGDSREVTPYISNYGPKCWLASSSKFKISIFDLHSGKRTTMGPLYGFYKTGGYAVPVSDGKTNGDRIACPHVDINRGTQGICVSTNLYDIYTGTDSQNAFNMSKIVVKDVPVITVATIEPTDKNATTSQGLIYPQTNSGFSYNFSYKCTIKGDSIKNPKYDCSTDPMRDDKTIPFSVKSNDGRTPLYAKTVIVSTLKAKTIISSNELLMDDLQWPGATKGTKFLQWPTEKNNTATGIINRNATPNANVTYSCKLTVFGVTKYCNIVGDHFTFSLAPKAIPASRLTINATNKTTGHTISTKNLLISQ